MFEKVEMAPPDAILGLTEAFKADSNPEKINLGVGVYKDAQGNTPILPSVEEAEERILEDQISKSYLAINGSPEYGKLVRELLFGQNSEINSSRRAVTAHTPGGTGALRIAGDYLKANHPGASIWLSQPTWPNHPGVFTAAGLEIKSYPYFDAEGNCLAFDQMLEAFTSIPEGDVVLLHACCHNPTGVDLTADQWSQVADVLAQGSVLPLVDFAYQGFAEGINEDAAGLRMLADEVDELIICSSFSKNLGLYCERTGALTVVAADQKAGQAVLSNIKKVIRTNYSNPPAHGGAIVIEVLSDPDLRGQWEGEVTEMRDRINGIRKLFVETLAAKGAKRDFSFIADQRGMFSFSGLNKDQVNKLRDEYSIYIVGSGRINVAGITPDNVERLSEAVVSVL